MREGESYLRLSSMGEQDKKGRTIEPEHVAASRLQGHAPLHAWHSALAPNAE